MASLATTPRGSAAAIRPGGAPPRAPLALFARPRSTLLCGPSGGGALAAVAVGALPRTLRPSLLPPPRAAATEATDAALGAPNPDDGEQPISLTPAAMRQLERLRREEGRDRVLLRMGVRAGGCSGMSYDMKFEDEANVDAEDDTVLEFGWAGVEVAGGGDGAANTPPPPPLRVAVDGKSLLFLFGMQIDYSDALVGGGFKFINPLATDSCGCGKSFSA